MRACGHDTECLRRPAAAQRLRPCATEHSGSACVQQRTVAQPVCNRAQRLRPCATEHSGSACVQQSTAAPPLCNSAQWLSLCAKSHSGSACVQQSTVAPPVCNRAQVCAHERARKATSTGGRSGCSRSGACMLNARRSMHACTIDARQCKALGACGLPDTHWSMSARGWCPHAHTCMLPYNGLT